MGISTRILDEASDLMSTALVDSIDVYVLGPTRTEGFTVVRDEVPFQREEPALVQTTTLANATESRVADTFSIKVRQGFPLEAGMMVQVIVCVQEPELEGVKFLIDKVSHSGLSTIRKAVASTYHTVDQQGKGEL